MTDYMRFTTHREIIVGRVYNILRAPAHLLHFSRLQSLTLDFGSEGLHTQFDCVQKLFNVSSSVERPSSDFIDGSAAVSYRAEVGSRLLSLTRLKIVKLPCINQHLLQKIACAFPNLVSLELESTSRLNLSCCSHCYEDSLTLTMHSLVARRYTCAENLAVRLFAFSAQTLHSSITDAATYTTRCYIHPPADLWRSSPAAQLVEVALSRYLPHTGRAH